MIGYRLLTEAQVASGKVIEPGNSSAIHEEPILLERGFHFCTKVVDLFRFYEFDPKNRVFEIQIHGTVDKGVTMHTTNAIRVIREMPWPEVIEAVNFGRGNTGFCNVGNLNTGHKNVGDANSGSRNTGHKNCDDKNTGHYNAGHSNSGNRNIGCHNTGSNNAGSWNTGNGNIGHYNTGCFNKGAYLTGAFCIGENDFKLFNKPSGMLQRDFLNSPAGSVLNRFDLVSWVEDSTQPTGGKLELTDYRKAFRYFWGTLSAEERNLVTSLPNFDADIFEEITGVRV